MKCVFSLFFPYIIDVLAPFITIIYPFVCIYTGDTGSLTVSLPILTLLLYLSGVRNLKIKELVRFQFQPEICCVFKT